MSRVLSQLLGADEASLRLQIRELEMAAGRPSADIRLLVDVKHKTRRKLAELGLDPDDTTGQELFTALQQKIVDDELAIRHELRIPADAVGKAVAQPVAELLSKHAGKVFAIKHVALRKILRASKPKATMKKLGYRSLDSMLKHEAMPKLLAATLLVETKEWHAHRRELYNKLSPSDFEVRDVQFVVPEGKNWPNLAKDYVDTLHSTIVSLPEAGTVVVLPVETHIPAITLTSMLFAIESANHIKAISAFMKLHQVQPDFGAVVAKASYEETQLAGIMPGQALSWHDVHWFFGQSSEEDLPDVFAPHVQADDMRRHSQEDILTSMHDSLAFWQGSPTLAHVHGSDIISLNLFDVALSVCNSLTYGERVVHHMQKSLRRELMSAYMQYDAFRVGVNDALEQRMQPEYADY